MEDRLTDRPTREKLMTFIYLNNIFVKENSFCRSGQSINYYNNNNNNYYYYYYNGFIININNYNNIDNDYNDDYCFTRNISM